MKGNKIIMGFTTSSADFLVETPMRATLGLGGKIFMVSQSTGGNYQELIREWTTDYDGEVRFVTSLALAEAAVVANRGDIVFIAPGYQETVTSAAAITFAKAGVTWIGLGSGNDRPRVTFSTSTAASVVISGSGIKMLNIIGLAGINGLLNPFNVTGDQVTLGSADKPLEWRDASASVEATRAILATTVLNLSINLIYKGSTSGSSVVNAIRLVGVTTARITIDANGVCTTGWVEFLTTASTNVVVNGYMYTQGITNFTRDVVDTVTGSKWFATINDGSAGLAIAGGSGAALASSSVSSLASTLAVPSADAVTNTNERDVIGNKTDAAVTAVGTTKSIAAYAKGLITMNTVQSADSTSNAFAGDVIGNKTDAAVYFPTTTKSLEAYLKGASDLQEQVVTKAAAVIAAGTATIFTVAGGPIEVLALLSICVTGNDTTATLLKWAADPTDGAATDLCTASSTMASLLAGASAMVPGAFGSALTLTAAGTVAAGTTKFIVPAGIITTVTTGGATTGTWTHHLRYRPLAKGVTVV